MKLGETLRRAAECGSIPRAAILHLLEDWTEVSQSLLDRLGGFLSGRDRSADAAAEAFYIVHLCGEKSERGAFAPLCRMIAKDPSIVDWLGDAVTETLPGILVQTFNGDVRALQRAIESPVGDVFARSSALCALGYLARARGAMADADLRPYMQRLLRKMEPRGQSVIWMNWAATAANLGFSDFRGHVEGLGKDGFLPQEAASLDVFDRQIQLARSDRHGVAGFAAEHVLPLDNAIAALEALAGDGDDRLILHSAPFSIPVSGIDLRRDRVSRFLH